MTVNTSSVVGDRLYGISMRPHELALYGERVSFTLRYSPIFDEPAQMTERHFTLLVLEIHAEVVMDGQAPKRLQLVKCGWEMELSTSMPCLEGTLVEQPTEVPLLLSRIADTINDLARRAGLEAPLGPMVVDDLVANYRKQATSTG